MSLLVSHDEANTWRRCDGSPVLTKRSELAKHQPIMPYLVTKATHSSPDGLLDHM